MNCNCGFPSTHTHTHTDKTVFFPCVLPMCKRLIATYKPPQSSVVMIPNPKKPGIWTSYVPWDSWVLLVSWIHTCYVHFCSNQPCRSIRMPWPLLLKTRWSSQRSVQLREGLSPQFPRQKPPLFSYQLLLQHPTSHHLLQLNPVSST